MKYLASFSHEELNAWLKDNGFDIQLEPFKRPTDFGAGSIQDVKVSWVVAGQENQVKNGKKEYPAVKLSTKYGQNEVRFGRSKSYPNTIAEIVTANGDVVSMTVADDESLEHTDLLVKVSGLTVNTRENFENIVFPMIDLDDKPDIGWLKGLSFQGVSDVDGGAGTFEISQALQQTMFKMNLEGARVKSAVVVGVTRACVSMPPPEFRIDKPFYFWITRPGMTLPYFAAYLDKDCWKDPGSLKMAGDK